MAHPNMRMDQHLVLELATALDVALHVGENASRVAGARTAMGHDHPLI